MKNHWIKYFAIPNTWKAVELEAYDNTKTEKGGKIDTWNFQIKRRRKIDHAGVEFEAKGPERIYHLKIYDKRHWNDEEDRFKKYD